MQQTGQSKTGGKPRRGIRALPQRKPAWAKIYIFKFYSYQSRTIGPTYKFFC